MMAPHDKPHPNRQPQSRHYLRFPGFTLGQPTPTEARQESAVPQGGVRAPGKIQQYFRLSMPIYGTSDTLDGTEYGIPAYGMTA